MPVTPETFALAFNRFLAGLTDYSTDQRGDVGSWIRVAGLLALGSSIAIASGQAEPLAWISQNSFELAIAGIVKLGMEKLEPVRAAAWRAWRMIRAVDAGNCWILEGNDVWGFDVRDER